MIVIGVCLLAVTFLYLAIEEGLRVLRTIDESTLNTLLAAILSMIAWLLTVGALAQEAPRPGTPHPETGEIGTWIPLWLEQEHLLDDAALQTCRADLALTEKEIREAHQALTGSREVVTELNGLLDSSEARELALRERLQERDARLERRARLAWGTSGTAVTALAIIALLLWHP